MKTNAEIRTLCDPDNNRYYYATRAGRELIYFDEQTPDESGNLKTVEEDVALTRDEIRRLGGNPWEIIDALTVAPLLENWESTTAMMDDDIREALHAKLAPCTKEEFLKAYMEAHEEEFGEEFDII